MEYYGADHLECDHTASVGSARDQAQPAWIMTSLMRSNRENWDCIVWRSLREVLLILFNCLKAGCGEVGVALLSQLTSNRVRGNGLYLHQWRFRLREFLLRKSGEAFEQVFLGSGGVTVHGGV